MSLDPLIRRLSLVAGIFAMIGTILGVVAISTSFWTWNSMNNGMEMRPTTLANGTMIVEERWDARWNVSSLLRWAGNESLFLSFSLLCL